MRNEVMKYPDKLKYDQLEIDNSLNGKTLPKTRQRYNDVWRIFNGKYIHTVNGKSFPDYWDEKQMRQILDLGMEARGNFLLPSRCL